MSDVILQLKDVDKSYLEKKYDFVYFAANVSKAGDYAIEAFALARYQMPGITLNMSGFCSPELKATQDKRIN